MAGAPVLAPRVTHGTEEARSQLYTCSVPAQRPEKPPSKPELTLARHSHTSAEGNGGFGRTGVRGFARMGETLGPMAPMSQRQTD